MSAADDVEMADAPPAEEAAAPEMVLPMVDDALLATFPSHVGRAVAPLEDSHLREAAAARARAHDRATKSTSWQMLAFCAVCRPDDQHDGVLLLSGAEDDDAPLVLEEELQE